MIVSELMARDVATTSPGQSMIAAARVMARKNASSLLAVEKDVIVGIISERDFVYLNVEERDVHKTMVREIMSAPVITVEKDDPLEDALARMQEEGVHKLPVTDHGKLVGMITETTITDSLYEKNIKPDVYAQGKTALKMCKSLEYGNVYLALESKPVKSLNAYTELVESGVEGLCLTRQTPEEIKSQPGLEKTMAVMLTEDPPDGTHSLNPHDIHGISIAVGEYINKSDKSIILLTAVPYLITQNKFDLILRLIQSMRDKVKKSDTILIIALNPKAIDEKQLTLIKQETDARI